MVDDEPMDDTATKPVHEPLEHETRKQSKSLKGKSKHGKTRRGFGKNKDKNKINEKNRIRFSLLGSNANGINSKKESIYQAINIFKPSVLTLQETKSKKTGSIKIPGYQIFEKL